MKKLKQLYRHNPDTDSYGDCWRTAIACLLDCDSPQEVPHFCRDSETKWLTNSREWLKEKGIQLITIQFSEEYSQLPEEIMDYMALRNPDMPYIFGAGNDRNIPHAFICENNEVIWDPSGREQATPNPVDPKFGVAYIYILTRRL